MCGMFDSYHTKCPKCKRELEFQSKTGECMLTHYYEDEKDGFTLSPIVAFGMNGDVAKCEFCEINWKLVCDLPETVKTKLVETTEKKNYSGNYNPKLPENIKRTEELKKFMETT